MPYIVSFLYPAFNGLAEGRAFFSASRSSQRLGKKILDNYKYSYYKIVILLKTNLYITEAVIRTIKISEEVWQAIADKGKFGETENDVLERVFNIQGKSYQPQGTIKVAKRRKKFADKRMSADVLGKTLHVDFQDGSSRQWALPDPTNKVEIRRVRQEAVDFAKQNNASFGQEQAVKKALTNAGYWLIK